MTPLSPQQLETALAAEGSWKLVDGALVHEWVFAAFLDSITFVQGVAQLAEAANHHPDIDIRYNRVKLALVTHDAGGITQRDLDLSRQISAAYPG